VPGLLRRLQVFVLILHCCQEEGGGQGREVRQTQALFSNRECVLLTAHAAAYGSPQGAQLQAQEQIQGPQLDA